MKDSEDVSSSTFNSRLTLPTGADVTHLRTGYLIAQHSNHQTQMGIENTK